MAEVLSDAAIAALMDVVMLVLTGFVGSLVVRHIKKHPAIIGTMVNRALATMLEQQMAKTDSSQTSPAPRDESVTQLGQHP